MTLGCTPPCYLGSFANATNYEVTVTARTPAGIAIDGTVDPFRVDRIVQETSSCLWAKYPTGELPRAVTERGHCLVNRFQTNTDCLTIKIPTDAHIGCSGEEVFPCSVNPALCEAKGLTPTSECPCFCRAAIQDNSVIVVTPNLKLLSAELIRIWSTCNFVWTEGLQECYTNNP